MNTNTNTTTTTTTNTNLDHSETIYQSSQIFEFEREHLKRVFQSPVSQAIVASVTDMITIAQFPRVQANVWFGSSGVCTPLHYDASTNLFHQLIGNKTVWLFPPSAASSLGLYPWGSELQRSCYVGVHTPQGLNYTAVDLHRGYKTDLTAGDSLLIPAYWLHHVCASSASASVSIWATSEFDIETKAMSSLMFPHLQPWNIRQRLRAIVFAIAVVAGSTFRELISHLQSRYAFPVVDVSVHAISEPTQRDTCDSDRDLLPDQPHSSLDKDLTDLLHPWLTRFQNVLKSLSPDVRVIVLANVFEALLFACLNVKRGRDDERAAVVVHIITSCLGSTTT
eukprot:m.130021 g.130021  ORF g.130021 m.130021 type:complete len:337 (+) comp29450_c0_seq1:3-1013(+)